MATQTETYKLNKPARTDKIGIDLLNENMDIIEEELKKRPLSAEIAGATFYDLDLSAWVTVEFAGFAISSSTSVMASDDSNLPGGAAALLSAIASGSLPRVKLKDNNGAKIVVVFDVCETSTDGATTTTNCTGTTGHFTYDVIDSYGLKIEETAGNYTVAFYARRKVSSEGTVKLVNGIAADETGNVQLLSTTGLAIDWTNGTYTETLSDGTSHTEDIEFNANGVPIKFGSMAFSITGG